MKNYPKDVDLIRKIVIESHKKMNNYKINIKFIELKSDKNTASICVEYFWKNGNYECYRETINTAKKTKDKEWIYCADGFSYCFAERNTETGKVIVWIGDKNHCPLLVQ